MLKLLAVPAMAVTLAVSGTAYAEPGSAPAPADRAHAIAQDKRADAADAALEKVQDILSGHAPAARSVDGPSFAEGHEHGRTDLTLALRDLVLLKDALSAADRKAADRILARPTPGPGDPDAPNGAGYTTAEAAPACGTYVCVHYVATTNDAPVMTDTTPNNGIPDYVETVLATLESVHTKYVAAGYRPPKSDLASTNNGEHGGNGQGALTDIYLKDIGGQQLYGYCTTDDPNLQPGSGYQYWDASAYCVLDDDYALAQFPRLGPLANLQVTAAHEYFHAVQFAYDLGEDTWFMEATATWAEDELYDAINDNRQYLAVSPLRYPLAPLDHPDLRYGDWIFFRYLSEKFPSEAGGMPIVVRDIWRRADGSAAVGSSAASTSRASIFAVKGVLASYSVSNFPKFLSKFAAVNRLPQKFYEEGSAYPTAAPSKAHTLKSTKRSIDWYGGKVNHLASANIRFKPGDSLKATDWRLKVTVNGPKKYRGTAATIQVLKRSGSVSFYTVTLNKEGDGVKTVPFSYKNVKRVEVTLTNGSTRFNCWTGGAYSCFGSSLDDNLTFKYKASAYRS